MSATPIPRTMMMLYGDMDISKIGKNPWVGKIITLSKPEKKLMKFGHLSKIKLKINQVFWVCPLIEKSAILDFHQLKEI